jgi:hypothetical protein
MSELKVILATPHPKMKNACDGAIEVYLKSAADKVIADLEESHKMEVEQLLIEIVELKAQKAQAEDDCAYWKMREGNAVNAMHETEEYAMQLYNELRHHKYKRCLAMAKLCRSVWAAAIFIPEKGGTDKQAALYMKWERRWLALADKFKEVK